MVFHILPPIPVPAPRMEFIEPPPVIVPPPPPKYDIALWEWLVVGLVLLVVLCIFVDKDKPKEDE